ncbi:MAG: tRNA pseudouridine(38-40) synthase TruA [Acidimicrobiia bacterium]|nr:tRNA pseudouridine(38-40) synthase TruA [Acidimicrobiia bacterium]
MPIVRVDLSYDGTDFRGYARQDGQRTVQGELEEALSVVLGHQVAISVAGRTDAGVHARGQVVSFQTPDAVDARRLMRSLNGLLGGEVVIRSISEVDKGFNARFSARSRTYRYLIGSSPTDPLKRHYIWYVDHPLDRQLMRATATHFLGEHDFSSFCRAAPGKSNTRRVERSEWIDGAELLEFWISANAFCHQMVRSLVGLCYDVGRGFLSIDQVPAIIEERDRSGVATVAPPHGLTLWQVDYA